MEQLAVEYFIPITWKFVACVGFGFILNVQGIGLLISAGGGALGWLVYKLLMDWSGSVVLSAFLAAMMIGIYSETIARLRRCPVTGYLQIALLPLVPGAGVYYAMRYCVEGEVELFLSNLLATFGIAAALSVGAMLVSSVLRALLPRLHLGGR